MKNNLTAPGVLFLLLAVMACNTETAKETEMTTSQAETPVKNMRLQELNKQIQGDKDNAELYHQRAKYYLSEQKINDALGDINKALQLNENNSDFYITLSDIYLAMGQGIKCEDALKKALRKDPDNLKATLKMGELNYILRDYKESLTYLNEAIQADNSLSTPYLIKGYTFLETGDTNTAIENFRMAVDKDPSNYDAIIQLAFIHKDNNSRLAEDYFQNALGVRPNSEEALYGLAMYYQNNTELEKAMETYERILAANPNHILSYYNMGYIQLVYLENFQTASDYFSNAIDLDPSYTNAFYNRGYAKELMGDYMGARKDYKKALDITPNLEIAVEALNRLDRKQTTR